MLNVVIPIGAFLLGVRAYRFQWYRNWKKNDRSELPKDPGVYIFYGRRGKVVHVGHSGNLRGRIVPSHESYGPMLRFDFRRCRSKDAAFKLEMKLQAKLGYRGR